MEPLLFLVHRIPFPPNKGDKVRSYNLLRFLASRYEVHLGAFIDDGRDLPHCLELGKFCASTHFAMLRSVRARARSVVGLLTGEPLTLRYYHDGELARWVEQTIRERHIEKAVVYSSAMAQYVTGRPNMHVVVDFVDVDSDKWRQYGGTRRWPWSAIYRREATRLLQFERKVAAGTAASVFVTQAEAALFRSLAPEAIAQVHWSQNGVDSTYFAPLQERPNPFAPDEEAIVFTGVMDYWPNVDAVEWFVRDVLPAIVAARPRARFHIVGMRPTPAVLALANGRDVNVTGMVPDVRPYLQHAHVVVAPLRVARGVQVKVLEAMAMAKPVVVSAAAAKAITGEPGVDFEVAGDAAGFAERALALMQPEQGDAIGAAARRRVLADYSWAVNLTPFERLLGGAAAGPVVPEVVAKSRVTTP
jgi:sugar transferase (PEP-CTERM/EpsH1 system associated)